KKCGGCQLDTSYAEQLEFKMRLEQKLLGKFGKIEPIIGMYYPYHYRNKVQAAFAYDKRAGRVISGVYQSNSHKIVNVDSCNIEDKKADEIIVSIRKLAKDFRFEPYNEDTGSGSLRHVLVKRGFKTNQIMVVIVTKGPIIPAKNNFVKALLKLHPEITTIIHNINPYDTNLVLGDRENVLFGKGYIEDELMGCTFRISAKSFYQINPQQTEKLYGTAIEYAGLTGKESVLDAYCGTGTIGIIAARRGAKNVIGVELEKAAVKDAISNAKRNEIDNIYFYNADATGFINEMADAGEHLDVILMDPPRAGSTEEFLDACVHIAPDRIVYVSCNPETLARDLSYITKKNYKVEKIQPVDMFPHTAHVETVVLLSKKKIQGKRLCRNRC
ncbi:MAG: 23S rRNA (uracil(1939)-C(5))-methyltransferase RlmD, partial [Oscillospiraceae bacterium]|nr:23S rRNA (uracil(1939)-C(5))-methyltransferase RlmD [Candidatus Limimonas coprohippi]